MLPSKTTFQLAKVADRPAKVLSFKLPEDLASKILSSSANGFQIHFDAQDPSQNVQCPYLLFL